MWYPLAIGLPSGGEWIVIAIIGLLIFGKRLPDVGRDMGKAIMNFKKGMSEAQNEIMQVDPEPTPARPLLAHDAKFDPYTGEPLKKEQKFDPYTGQPIQAEATAAASHQPSPAADATDHATADHATAPAESTASV